VALQDLSFILPFVGLKLGKHNYDFEIGDAFFANYEYSLIQKGKIAGHLELEKKETMLIGDFSIKGTVEAECDRCGEGLTSPVKGEFRLIFKFEDEDQGDESLVALGKEAFELDVSDHFYELITVSLPSRFLHLEGDCDQEAMKKLKAHSAGEGEMTEEEIDPRWSTLKNLKS
jgi:uncharacterized protein